jgi:hypothetical protein
VRRESIDQTGSDEPARAHADIHIGVVAVEPSQRFIQRGQRADFIDRTQRATAGKGESDAGARCASGCARSRRPEISPFCG